MRLKVRPSSLSGAIVVPPSKSHTIRALLFGALGEGKTIIHHYLPSPDTVAMVRALRQLGIRVDVSADKIEIEGGTFRPPEEAIEAGYSGQVLRFITAQMARFTSDLRFKGDLRRPMGPLLSALEQLRKGEGIAPGVARLDGADSQPVSALLMSAVFLEGTTELHVANPGEKPWIDLTLHWLKKFGAQVTHMNYTHYTITGPLSYRGFEMTIPGDLSSAAFPFVAARITQSCVDVQNIDLNDCQGDKVVFSLIDQLGTTIDVNPCIDALPILAVAACFAEKPTTLTNAAIARTKESDRLAAITAELRKMGAVIEEKADELYVTPAPLIGAKVEAHNDHRIAMALAVAGLAASGETVIEGGEWIKKSYPTFIQDFQALGADIHGE